MARATSPAHQRLRQWSAGAFGWRIRLAHPAWRGRAAPWRTERR